MLYLPSYTATAWYHKKLPADLQQAGPARGARRGRALGRRATIAPRWRRATGCRRPSGPRWSRQMARYTGLSERFLDLNNLRVADRSSAASCCATERRTVGRFDSRYLGIVENAGGSSPEFDPSLAAVRPAYTATFNQYVRTELGYKSDDPYHILGGAGGRLGLGPPGDGLSRDGARRSATRWRKNPHMKVLVASGYYDLATPYAATEYTLAHMKLDPALRHNVRVETYEAGHMMYVHRPSLAKLKRDAGRFLEESVKSLRPGLTERGQRAGRSCGPRAADARALSRGTLQGSSQAEPASSPRSASVRVPDDLGSSRRGDVARWAGVLMLAIGLVANLSVRARGAEEDAGTALFNVQIGPLLTSKCLTCHTPRPEEGGPRPDPARLGPGRRRERRGDRAGQARGEPADREGRRRARCRPSSPLTPEQVAAFRAWIEAGAPYPDEPLAAPARGPDWWSLRPIRRPDVRRDGRDRGLGPHPDRRLRPRQAEASTGSARPPRPTARRLIRRLTLRPDRPAADPRGGRGVRRRPGPPTPTSGWSTACSPRPTTASAGAGTGSTWSGSARATATRRTCRGPTPGPTATTSSGLQPRHAVRPVRPRAARRRRARRRPTG